VMRFVGAPVRRCAGQTTAPASPTRPATASHAPVPDWSSKPAHATTGEVRGLRERGGIMRIMKHLGILAHSAEGAALCFRAFCQEGFGELGPHDHPDVTMDCIALARSMSAWDSGDYPSIRAILSASVRRLAGAGADFFVCPDNTAHMALEEPGEDLALPGLHIAEVVAERAVRDGRARV